MTGRGDLSAIMNGVGSKIGRIRQLPPDLSPVWKLPNDQVQTSSGDPWVKRLMWSAVACLVLALALFAMYKLMLGSAAGDVARIAAAGRS